MDVEYLMRCKLPSSCGYHSSPSGDTQYENDYRDAIFANKPEGFEIAWSSRSTWPIDKDGNTWVKLYCTDKQMALQYYIDATARLKKELDRIKSKLAEII